MGDMVANFGLPSSGAAGVPCGLRAGDISWMVAGLDAAGFLLNWMARGQVAKWLSALASAPAIGFMGKTLSLGVRQSSIAAPQGQVLLATNL
jgi:hypothetical protein